MNILRYTIIIALMAISSCGPKPTDYAMPARYQGFAKIVQVGNIENAKFDITYTIRNGTEKSWCLRNYDPEDPDPILFKTANNGQMVDIHGAHPEAIIPGEIPPPEKLMPLLPGKQMSFTKTIDVRNVGIDEINSDNVWLVAQVEMNVFLCGKLINGNKLPYNFKMRLSTDFFDGNSFVLVSDPSKRFKISNVSQ